MILISILVFLFGCAATGPIRPYAGPYPESYQYLSQLNPSLATEFGRLPELQDGINDPEKSALEQLILIYKTHPMDFDRTFDQMNKVGLPDSRKYCSPLQALFWLALAGETEQIISLIQNYSLGRLLSIAWNFNPPTLSDGEITEVIQSISDKSSREQFLSDRQMFTNEQIQHFLLIEYRTNKAAFSKKPSRLLETASRKNHYWSDFNTVVDRLNAPELVNYYEQAEIVWVDWRTLPKWPVSPWYVFKKGQGDCTAIADFTALCLTRAGYRAYEYKVAPTRPVDNHHSICIFYVDGIKYVMDNGSSYQKGIYLFK